VLLKTGNELNVCRAVAGPLTVEIIDSGDSLGDPCLQAKCAHRALKERHCGTAVSQEAGHPPGKTFRDASLPKVVKHPYVVNIIKGAYNI
jgi:hypothetical protein